MPSTYSTSLGLELIGNGEQAGTWGTTTNTNLGTLLEQAIAGVQSITLVGNYTLTDFNGLPDEARNAVLVFGGLLAAPCNVIVPAVEKVYIVRNFSNATVTLKTSGGNGVAIANAASEVIFCDGTNIFSATQFNYIDGDLTVTGNASVGKNLVVLNQATFGANLFANSSTGQIFLPTGNTASRSATGQNGILRYNSELAIYEGYSNGTWVRFQTFPQGVYTINYLIVAGGGAGGFVNAAGGGGGGGGFKASSLSVTPGATYTMVIGGGGTGIGGAGTNSSITGVDIATGGGAGGQTGTSAYGANGSAGGSGGGGGSGGADPTLAGAGGAGISGQGFAGGGGQTFCSGGGGGGAAVGATSVSDSVAGAGGAGFLNTLTGSNVYYSGGGGGGGGSSAAAGGIGGGGTAGNNGSVNTGGGAGGGNFSGGSGVIVVSVPTASYSGTTTGAPTITISGANTILKYTVSGTYTA
jgi:hypothetical protein